MERTTIDFGIDLGTTNSTIAVIDGTDAKVIPNKGGSGITPSAVWIDKRGGIHVGFEAKQRALIDDPENADLEFKLRMGLGEEGNKYFNRSRRKMSPEELSAEVLKSLKMDVQTNLGEEVLAAVITVPAAFELPQTNATQKSAVHAGFGRSPLLLEPVAASLAYGFQTESENVYWLVYDFGGGTFDAAVMRIRDGLIQVVNHGGDNHLGGKLIDWDIVTKRMIPALAGQFNVPDFRRGNPKWRAAIGKMKYYAEQGKVEVCRTRAPYEIWIEGLCTDADGKEVDFAYTLTPDDIKQISDPYIERTLGLCRKTLRDKDLAGSDMERILMVGGTTLNPWVREAVQAEIGNQVEFGIDPVTVVARGAAVFASTQALAVDYHRSLPTGTWRVEIEHEPVGNVPDPDIGGRALPESGLSPEGCTIEFVDTKTQWRSGRVLLGPDGVFMTQLFAEAKRRCEYAIELWSPQGSKIQTSPDRVVYTLGVIPDKPPAPNTIGVGLASDEMKPYIKKGTKLPTRQSEDHRTVVALRAGHKEDQLRIPILEGENARATRNHPIGSLNIDGSQIKRDLPVGSQIEVTIMMDESQQVKVLVFVPILDEDFPGEFDSKMQNLSIAELKEDLQRQKTRMENLRQKADGARSPKAEAALKRIRDEQLLEQVDSLMDAAQEDRDALSQLDRRLRDLTAAIDDVEDSVEWPVLLKSVEESQKDAERVVKEYGNDSDKKRYEALVKEVQPVIEAQDSDLLRRYIGEFDGLWWRVVDRLPGFHVGRFKRLQERLQSMSDLAKAEELIAQGQRAIANDDINALKATNRQLVSLLPKEEQAAEDRRIGGIV